MVTASRMALKHRVTLVAHVREVHPAVLACHGRQSDELLGARIDGRRIDERSGHPDGSVFHPFPHQLSHLLKLLRLWGDILFPEHYAPHLREPNVVHHVDGDAVVLKDGEVLRVPPPAHGVAVNDREG